jgi:hypothetical protein
MDFREEEIEGLSEQDVEFIAETIAKRILTTAKVSIVDKFIYDFKIYALEKQ